MQLARIIGTVTATAKNERLVGATLLLADIVDGAGKVLAPGQVVVDTCGAGVGETVIVASGSAARMPAGLATAPVDMAVIAIADRVSLG
jgi:ethanolamine utilization protein EutN